MASTKETMTPDNEPYESDGDRGMPSINQRGPAAGGIGQKIILGLIIIVVVLALVAVNGGFSSSDDTPRNDSPRSSTEISNRLGPAPALPPPPAPPQIETPDSEPATEVRTGQIAPPAPSYPTSGSSTQQADDTPTPADRKRESGLLAFGSSSNNQSSGSGQGAGSVQTGQMQGGQGGMMMGVGDDGSGPDRADGLAANLQPTQLEGARAGLIADRNMFVTRGTFLDCALETAISSDVPGMTSCRLTRDVYSTSGRVLLLERGSRITGQYQSGLQRGQARIFVLWDRIETPNGVVINLDSPGTDSLGRSGHEGHINTHFWQRWGGALMLSLVDDIGTYVANEASGSGSGGNQIQFGGTTNAASNAASIALENSINIPPTLVKHQGEHINVFVARDLDFRGVYDLKVSN